MLVVVVTNVDAYLFLAFLDLTCHLEGKEQVFSDWIVPPDSEETKFGTSDQEASPSAGKNTGVVLVPCHTQKCALQPFSMVWIFWRSLGVICYNR